MNLRAEGDVISMDKSETLTIYDNTALVASFTKNTITFLGEGRTFLIEDIDKIRAFHFTLFGAKKIEPSTVKPLMIAQTGKYVIEKYQREEFDSAVLQYIADENQEPNTIFVSSDLFQIMKPWVQHDNFFVMPFKNNIREIALRVFKNSALQGNVIHLIKAN